MSRKWEQLYEYYESTEAQERMAELKSKREDGQATPEEISEYNKMRKIIGYLPEVENLKVAIDALENNLEILKEEYNAREEAEKEIKEHKDSLRKKEKEADKLEKEIDKLRTKAENLHEVAENDKYWNAIFEVQSKEEDLLRLNNEIKEHKEKKMPESVSIHDELSGLSKEDLRKEIFKTAGQINKCNLAARCMLEGQSKHDINLKVNKNWVNRKLTSKTPLPLTRKEREQKMEEKTAEKAAEKTEHTTESNSEQELDSEQIQHIENVQNNSQENGTRATVDMSDAPAYVENIFREEEAKRQQERASAEARRQQAVKAAARGQEATVDNNSQEPQVQNDNLEDRALAMIPLDDIKREAENKAKRKHWIRNLVSKIPFATKSQNLMEKYIKTEVDQRVEKEIARAKKAISEVEGTFKTEQAKVAQEQQQAKVAQEQEQQQAKISSSRQQRNEFIKGLSNFDVMDIAEKGIDGMQEEKIAAEQVQKAAELEKRKAERKARQEKIAEKRVLHNSGWVEIEGENINTDNYATRENPDTGKIEMKVDKLKDDGESR